MVNMSSRSAVQRGMLRWEGSGWWADADYDDSTITSFYPPNFPIIRIYYTAGALVKRRRCDSGNNIPTMTSMSYHPGGVNCRVRRRLGALHQEYDQLLELGYHHAHKGCQPKSKLHNSRRCSAGRLAVAVDDQRRRGAQLRPVLIESRASRHGFSGPARLPMTAQPKFRERAGCVLVGSGWSRPRSFSFSPPGACSATIPRVKNTIKPTSARPRWIWPPVGLLLRRRACRPVCAPAPRR